MTTDELIKALRDWADGMAMPGRRQLVNEAADRLEELDERAADALEGQLYGAYITAAEGATKEVLENAVKEHALKTLIEMGALQIIINMTPEIVPCDDGTVMVCVTGAWKIRLPKEEKNHDV